jgi:hypothetical protein
LAQLHELIKGKGEKLRLLRVDLVIFYIILKLMPHIHLSLDLGIITLYRNRKTAAITLIIENYMERY